MPGVDARAAFHHVFDGIGRFVERKVNFGISHVGFDTIVRGVIDDPDLNRREDYVIRAIDRIVATISNITSFPDGGRRRRMIETVLQSSLESEEPWMRIADSMPGVSGMDAPAAAIIGSALLIEMGDIIIHSEDPRHRVLVEVIAEIGQSHTAQIQAAQEANEQLPRPLRTQTLDIFANARIQAQQFSKRRDR